VATLTPDGTVKSIEPFITGFIQNNNYVAVRCINSRLMAHADLTRGP
jgi:hypothetical protein